MSYDESALLLMLVSFYECYNPSKVDTVPIILERFHGKEVELLHNLKQKYYLEAYPPFDNYIELRSILEQDCSATGSVETPTMTISRLKNQIKNLSTQLLSNTSKTMNANEEIECKLQVLHNALVMACHQYRDDKNSPESTGPASSSLQIMYMASQAELLVARTEITALQARVAKQNRHIQHLDRQLCIYKTADCADSIVQVEGAQRTISLQELKSLTALAKRSQNEIQQLEGKLCKLKDENREYKASLALAAQCRADLISNCNRQIAACQEAAAEHVAAMQEILCMEREDVLAQQIHLALSALELVTVTRDEDQRERQRLRFELITARRTIRAQSKEIRALSAQLVISTEKVDALSNGRQPYWEDEHCV